MVVGVVLLLIIGACVAAYQDQGVSDESGEAMSEARGAAMDRDADIYALMRGSFGTGNAGLQEAIRRMEALANLATTARNERDEARKAGYEAEVDALKEELISYRRYWRGREAKVEAAEAEVAALTAQVAALEAERSRTGAMLRDLVEMIRMEKEDWPEEAWPSGWLEIIRTAEALAADPARGEG